MSSMNDRFDLSFKNKEVRVWLGIMVPFMAAAILLRLLTEIHMLYSNAIALAAWTVFFIWRFSYRKKQRKASSA